MKKQKKKIIYKEDDGRTLYSMSGLYEAEGRPVEEKDRIEVNRKEKKAMRRALAQVMLPRLICVLIGFALCFLILYFWLK
ncbi:MAG: hypothetical protein NC310_00070 [Roseburia sp.]|nr:hypothetical protein [Anaeroplasma bactoclasticum]MCM1195449.1 hypothetical protein [Roseburia sp.]MCM1555928.1 hypothetical protein [Anaeroplasma bactoclasticum]